MGQRLTPEVAVGRGEQRVAGLAFTPGERLHLPQLLERVDPDLLVGADREPDARVAVAQSGQHAVAEVGLGGGTGDDDRVRLGQQPHVAVVDVDRVDHARARAEEAGSCEQLDRRASVLGGDLLEFTPLLGGVHVPDEIVALGVPRDRLEPRRRHRPRAVRRHPDGHPVDARRPLAQAVDPLQERLHGAVAEPDLTRRRRKIGPGSPPAR